MEELLRRHADAMGGKDALANIQTLDYSGTTRITQRSPANGAPLTLTGTSRRVLLPSRSVYACDTWGIMRDEWGWNGEIAWRKHSQDGLRRLHGEDELFVRLEASLVRLSDNYARSSGRMQQEPDDVADQTDETYYSVSIRDSSGQSRERVLLAGEHAKDAYLIAVRILQNGLPFVASWPTQLRFLNYQTVAGIKIPTVIRADSDPVSVEWRYKEFAANEPVDETLFHPPAPILRYTRNYRKLIGELLAGELSLADFTHRFNQLLKWESTGFPCVEYDALECLRRRLEEYPGNQSECPLPDFLTESARKVRDILEATE